jgi:hypothetical protein
MGAVLLILASLGGEAAIAAEIRSPALAIEPALPSLKQADPEPEPGAEPETEPEAPAVPALPEPIPAAVMPEAAGIVGLSPNSGSFLGIGHLRPRDLTSLEGRNWESSPLLNAGWLRSVALPIYVGPSGDPWGWLINGWLIIPGYDPIAIGRDATFSMVQADRGLYSFPVLELRPDGWFRFQYTAAGEAWAHTSHLQVGALALTIEPWEEQVITAAQVRFFKHGLSQGLRAAPRPTGPLRSLVAPNSLIRPLEVQGNWMRVEVTQPTRGCTPLPGSTTEEGWMRWRDTNRTLLVWFVTEPGCDRP